MGQLEQGSSHTYYTHPQTHRWDKTDERGENTGEKVRKDKGKQGLDWSHSRSCDICLSKQLVREQYHLSSPRGNLQKINGKAKIMLMPCLAHADAFFAMIIHRALLQVLPYLFLLYAYCLCLTYVVCPLLESSITARSTSASMWIIMFVTQLVVYVVEKEAYLHPKSQVDIVSSGIYEGIHTHMCLIDRNYNSMCIVCICVCGLEGSK